MHFEIAGTFSKAWLWSMSRKDFYTKGPTVLVLYVRVYFWALFYPLMYMSDFMPIHTVLITVAL